MSQESTAARAAPSSDIVRPAPPSATADRATGAGHPLAEAHGALGNNAVVQRLSTPAVQAKLEVGALDDPQEREAEEIADALASHPEETDPRHAGTDPHSLRRAPEDKKKPPEAASAQPPPKPGTAPPAGAPKGGAAAAAPGKQPAPAVPAGKDQPAGGMAAAGATKTPPAAGGTAAGATKTPPAAGGTGAAAAKAPPAAGTAAATKDQPPASTTPAGSHAKDPAAGGAGAEAAAKTGPAAAGPAAPKAGGVPQVTPEVEEIIAKAKGGGQPLPVEVLQQFEARLGRDLSKVRIHDGADAGKAATALEARAFTHGQDIFFAAGRYQPDTLAGRELLAHELTHTIQQAAATTITRRIQRQTGPAAATPGSPGGAGAAGVPFDADAKAIYVPSVEVPAFRAGRKGYEGKLTRPRNFDRDMAPGDKREQRVVWVKAMTGPVTARLGGFLPSIGAKPGKGGAYAIKTKGKGRSRQTYKGDEATLGAQLTVPDWDQTGALRGGKPRAFEVDHILELQLGGHNDLSNMELLERSVNGSSGTTIRVSIKNAVEAHIDGLTKAQRTKKAPKKSNWKKWDVVFDKAVGAPIGKQPAAQDAWPKEAIQAGRHLDPTVLEPGKPEGAGSADAVEIRVPAGPTVMVPPTGSGEGIALFRPFDVTSAQWNIGDDWKSKPDIATFTLELSKSSGIELSGPPPVVSIRREPNARYAGVLDKSAVSKLLAQATYKGLSEVQVGDIELGDDGLLVNAKIIASLPIVEQAEIDLTISGDEITISTTFDTGDFKLPGPMEVTSSSLTVSASNKGALNVTGKVEAEIEKLGKGFLEGGGGTSGFALKGGFDFTSDIFSTARATFDYNDGKYAAKGELAIGAGKVTGVKGGSLIVSYADGAFAATGHADLDVPGVKSADVSLSYDEVAGLKIGGAAKLSELPGISSGMLDVTVSQAPGASGYKVAGHGKARPKIPGVDAELTVDYDDGTFFAKAEVGYSRGLVKGRLEAGATNAHIDEATGKPAATGERGAAIVIFGTGTGTLKITPQLEATATLRLDAKGELSISGDLQVPGVNLWDASKPFKKALIPSTGAEIPVFGPVVLRLAAGLNLKAGYGPGVLSGGVGIDYNPSHEDQTKVRGRLKLHASAYAGIELYTQVGVGLGLPGASITGNIELGAEMRIEPSVNLDVPVEWTPGGGLSIEGKLDATFQPKLIFHLRATIVAHALGFQWDWPKDIGQKEYGSGLEFGMTLPITYETGKKFDIDLSAIEFRTPQIDPIGAATKVLKEALA